MGYRNIFIANTSKLSTKNEQLIVDNGETFSFPIEDINCLLVEDCHTVLSATLISKCAEAGVTLIICNQKHLPSAVVNPMNCYSRQLKQLKLQIAQSVPFKKRLWQTVVSQKIKNQAICLKILEKDGTEKLNRLADQIKSGDPSNIEGQAAAFYFKALFGNEFKRSEEIPLNAALDYGYALIRAVISRTLCTYGFEPALGIHHCSELNNFNLADDIIEPFRPFIDLYVSKTLFDRNEFTTADKALLLKSLNASIKVKDKKYSIGYAVEKTVQSYGDCLKTNKTDLILPDLIDIDFKSNE